MPGKKWMSMRSIVLFSAVFLLTTVGIVCSRPARACPPDHGYHYWQALGSQAAFKAVRMMRSRGIRIGAHQFIALTNAGYAEIGGRATAGVLDGLSLLLGVGRGDHSLIEVHSAPSSALWVAIYHKRSGFCAYLQVDPEALVAGQALHASEKNNLFFIHVLEKIDADHLFANAQVYAEKFDNKIFGGNEFRIVTIVNAVAAGAPAAAVRAFEFHDHYCPGVTSGILMACYLKSFFPAAPDGKYFVQSVQPWCKEDALMVILNATPGKGGYAVTYPSADDMAAWPAWAENASTIVYREDPANGIWEGIVLGYTGGDTGCPDYGHSVMNKLCADLWYLSHLWTIPGILSVSCMNFPWTRAFHRKTWRVRGLIRFLPWSR